MQRNLHCTVLLSFLCQTKMRACNIIIITATTTSYSRSKLIILLLLTLHGSGRREQTDDIHHSHNRSGTADSVFCFLLHEKRGRP
jgi:hypothetical protein